MIKKSIVIPALAVVASGIVLFGTTQFVHAQTPDNGPFSGLAQAIAQKFNLNQNDVQNVITQQMHTNMQNRMKNRLDKLVSSGKLTSSQEQAILTEMEKIRTEYPQSSLRNMSDSQRQQTMQKMKNEITSWAQSQGINLTYLMPGFGIVHRFWGTHPSVTPTP